MTKKNIIIAGYPKSGTTWISRLVAELAICPLKGDWGFDHIKPLYEEGENRSSPYDCYKTHFTPDQISSVSEKEVYKVIHVLRDPRDVVISGSHYFNFTNTPQKVFNRLGLTSLGSSLFSVSEEEKKKKMMSAVLQGDKKINQWLSMSWKDHAEAFNDKEVLTITYESMLTNPLEQCSKIVKYLQIDTDIVHIESSIKKQSFDKKKKEISHSEDIHFKKLLRKGEQGYWKNEFTEQEKDTFITYLATNTFYN